MHAKVGLIRMFCSSRAQAPACGYVLSNIETERCLGIPSTFLTNGLIHSSPFLVSRKHAVIPQRIVPIDIFFELSGVPVPGKNRGCDDGGGVAVSDLLE